MPAEAPKDLDNLRPIDHAVIAKPHTPIYKMHRYFARRPWSVFHELIKHYSNPGSIILDPFCGGGVTVVEGLRLKRKLVALDINPLATFITRLEGSQADLGALEDALTRVLAKTESSILPLYKCGCPRCSSTGILRWLEWSNVYECNQCHRAVPVAKHPKTRWGTYKCFSGCDNLINITHARLVGDIPIQVEVSCPKCEKLVRAEIADADAEKFRPNAQVLAELEREFHEFIPQDVMPAKLELRRPYNAHLRRYADFFTPRNRVATALLVKTIRDENGPTCDFLIGTFLSTINWAVRMCVLKKGSPAGWAAANFWTPQNPLEINVWHAFKNRASATIKGKEHSEKEINGCHVGTTPPERGVPEADAHILTQSSTHIPLLDNSVDAIISDPPYGGNVMYTELGNFFCVWVKEEVGVPQSHLIDDAEEAIVSKPHKKGLIEYRRLMYEVFRECHRVLKPNRWMVMTFHNREFKVWNAIHLAAHDAGFVLAEHDGMIYQPPIQQYTTTIYLYREGSMLGDFILSFQKVDKPPAFKAIEHAEMGRHIERLAGEAIIYHNGATLSTIYMKLIPWLLNNNLLEKIGEKEVEPFLASNFEERDGKWHVKEEPDEALREDLERYSQQHYKTSYSDAMKTVPVEARLEFLIRRLLYRKGQAAQDDILNEVYTNLINSNAADYGEIQRVLSRIAQLRDSTETLTKAARKGVKKRKVWRLKEDIEREALWGSMGADIKLVLDTTEESDHDLAIARLVELASLRGLRAHIGKAEQNKYTEFRRLTSDLPQRVAGMPREARVIVEQIDVLWHNGGKGIVAAFEVERTTTINSGIDRFRNLLAAAPDAEIELYLVVPKARGDQVRARIGSPANRETGLHRKIAYIYLEDLQITKGDAGAVEFEKIVRRVNGGKP